MAFINSPSGFVRNKSVALVGSQERHGRILKQSEVLITEGKE